MIPFLPALLTLGKTIGGAALGGAKLLGSGIWNLGKFMGSAAGNLLGGGRQVATVMGKPITYGMTKQGAGWLQYLPQALSLMQGLGGQQTQQTPEEQIQQQQYPMQFPSIDIRTPRISYGDIIAKMLQQYRGY